MHLNNFYTILYAGIVANDQVEAFKAWPPCISRINGIVAGGTKQRGNFSEVSAPKDTAHILKVTSELFPSIKVNGGFRM